MNILEELYHGNINPNAKSYIQKSSYAKAMDVFVYTALSATLARSNSHTSPLELPRFAGG